MISCPQFLKMMEVWLGWDGGCVVARRSSPFRVLDRDRVAIGIGEVVEQVLHRELPCANIELPLKIVASVNRRPGRV